MPHQRPRSLSLRRATASATSAPAPAPPPQSCPARRPKTPASSITLQIPSLYDATPLEVRLLMPDYSKGGGGGGGFARRAAVVAHPYAPLGGCCDDFVVLSVAALLVRAGWVVALFNFRGAGNSKGKTSWTGRPEMQDYAAVATWLLSFIRALPPPPLPSPSPLPSSSTPLPSTSPPPPPPLSQLGEHVELLLAGYSYGALVAAHAPPTSALEALLASPPSRPFAGVLLAARACARSWWDPHSPSPGHRSPTRPSPLFQPQSQPQSQSVSVPVTHTCYLLISPPLPPVSAFLMLPGWGRAAGGTGESDGGGGSLLDPEPLRSRARSRALAVWGDDDCFTAVRKYRRWDDRMSPCGDKWTGVEVEGAGHFWGEDNIGTLKAAVKAWLEEPLVE